MKKILYSEMSSLGSAMESLLQNPVIRSGMKKSTLFKFWDKVVGKKFEGHTKISSLNSIGNKTVLVVACESAVITNELMMYKNKLLQKINEYSNPLGIEIDDINFSHKIWEQENSLDKVNSQVAIQEVNPYKEDLTGFAPDEIELDPDEVEAIRLNISKNNALNFEQQERLFQSIVKDLKVQKFLQNK